MIICSKVEVSTLSNHQLQVRSFVFSFSCTQPDIGLLKAETCSCVLIPLKHTSISSDLIFRFSF
jgi:hypothetical protein